MINIENQIEYWRTSSDSDIETAEILISNEKYVQGLFFCHLCIEKILKALVVKDTCQIPPKSHNLKYLSELIEIEVSDEQKLFMAVLMKYMLEGRYPEYFPKIPQVNIVNDYLNKTKDLLKCLKLKL